jgi:hypothetical protein
MLGTRNGMLSNDECDGREGDEGANLFRITKPRAGGRQMRVGMNGDGGSPDGNGTQSGFALYWELSF